MPALLRTVYARLAQALEAIDLDPPDRVRVAPDRVVVDAVVLDAPWLQPLVRVVVVPAGGRPEAVADLAAARLDLAELTGEIAVDERLAVGGTPVRWWPGEPDRVDGTPDALGRALAWRAGRWELRQALAEAFAHPHRAPDLAAEDSIGE